VEGVTAVRKDTQYVILVIFRKANSAPEGKKINYHISLGLQIEQ